MYDDTMHNIAKTETKEVPSIIIREVERALSQIKTSKAPREDQILLEMITARGEKALRKIEEFFNVVLRTETVPKE